MASSLCLEWGITWRATGLAGMLRPTSGQGFWQLLLFADVFPGHNKRNRETSKGSVMTSALMPAARLLHSAYLLCHEPYMSWSQGKR